MEIKGRRVVITGANRGIGWALAKMFAQSGSHLHLVNRTSDGSQVSELEKLGAASVQVTSLDLSDRQAITRFLEKHQEDEVDVLVNNAGQLTGGLLENQTVDEIYSVLQVNVTALIHLTKGFLPGMLKRGRGKIVNNASVTGIMHFPCATTYAATKSAVIAFTQSLQGELKNTGVSTLLMITPGIETRMFKEIPNRYGPHIQWDLGKGMPAEQYADLIKDAILNDETVYEPTGFEGMGLLLARHSPRLFQKLVSARFRRS